MPLVFECAEPTVTVGESLLLSSHRPTTEAEKTALRAFVMEVAASAEQVTLEHCFYTWRELRSFAVGGYVPAVGITVGQFYPSP